MVDFDELKEKTSDFIREKPLLARISAIFLIFFVIALTVVFIQSKKPKAKKLRKTGKCIDFGANDARISGNRKRLLFVAKNRKLLERRRNK